MTILCMLCAAQLYKRWRENFHCKPRNAHLSRPLENILAQHILFWLTYIYSSIGRMGARQHQLPSCIDEILYTV
jgi:hypothetical protein